MFDLLKDSQRRFPSNSGTERASWVCHNPFDPIWQPDEVSQALEIRDRATASRFSGLRVYQAVFSALSFP
jgi:hypothetical protein